MIDRQKIYSNLPAAKKAILRDAQTEPPFSGRLLKNDDEGIYLCGACEQPIFSSSHKFDSGSGWPSFFDLWSKNSLIERADQSLGMDRIEVLCSNCQSHLGHLFDDGPSPTQKRYCINSLALKFKDKKGHIVEG